MMVFKPLKDWLVLEIVKPFQGIVLPESLDEKSSINSFKVIDRGPDCKYTEIGDTIVPYYNPVMVHNHDGQVVYFFKEEFVALVGR
jgi:hypothetical protein